MFHTVAVIDLGAFDLTLGPLPRLPTRLPLRPPLRPPPRARSRVPVVLATPLTRHPVYVREMKRCVAVLRAKKLKPTAYRSAWLRCHRRALVMARTATVKFKRKIAQPLARRPAPRGWGRVRRGVPRVQSIVELKGRTVRDLAEIIAEPHDIEEAKLATQSLRDQYGQEGIDAARKIHHDVGESIDVVLPLIPPPAPTAPPQVQATVAETAPPVPPAEVAEEAKADEAAEGSKTEAQVEAPTEPAKEELPPVPAAASVVPGGPKALITSGLVGGGLLLWKLLR